MRSIQPATLRTATLEELLEKLRRIASIQSLKATVELQLSVLSDDRSKKTQYRDVRGIILGRRPGLVRIQAQVPVTGQRAFDMVSNGETYEVYLPWKNRFFEGENRREYHSEKRLENIRPQHILEALLLEPPRDDEIPVLVNVEQGLNAYHVVQLQRKKADGGMWIARMAWFDRSSLELSRLEIYNQQGDVTTIARYREWKQDNSLPYPSRVVITRPTDGYDIAIHFLKPGVNLPVPDESFNLKPPEGVQVERIGRKNDVAPTRARAR